MSTRPSLFRLDYRWNHMIDFKSTSSFHLTWSSILVRSLSPALSSSSLFRGRPVSGKLLTIGDSAVGKTCLILRFAKQTFNPTFITTIGIDYKIKKVDVKGQEYKLLIWDTGE